MYNHGKIQQIQRTIYDPNEFIIENDICWVILYDRKCIEIARAKFYTKYYEILKNSNDEGLLMMSSHATNYGPNNIKFSANVPP